MRSLGVIALLLAACGPPGHESTSLSGGPDSTSTTEPTSSGPTTGETAAASSAHPTSTSPGTTTSTTSAPVQDVGTPDLPDDHPPGCQGKIDFLFVIGRAWTMETKQDALIAAFPDFAATIESAFADFDYHVLVANPEGLWGDALDCPPTISGCPKDGGCPGLDDPSYPCWAHYTPGALTACDTTQGAGVVFPAGLGASNAPCAFAGDRRFIQRDEPDLPGAFACAARLGYTGGGPAHAWATVQALSDELNDPGGCNDGFLRDDALLVVALITDLDDYNSPYSPLAWSELVLAAKGNNPDGVVLLGLLDDAELPEPRYCGTQDGPGEARLNEFMGYFEHTMTASVCMPSYGAFFEEAAGMVLDLCEVYVPH